jgi:CBS domain containing-hemolysin-like protein
VLPPSLPLLDAASAAAESPFDPGYLLPVLLLMAGAVFGGLRTLLGSSVRSSLLATLPDVWQQRAERALTRQPDLASATGLMRLFCIVAGSALLVHAALTLTWGSRILLWSAVGFGAAFALEGLPSLIHRRRGRRFVLAFLPVAAACAWLTRPLTWALERLLQRLAGAEAAQPAQELSAQLLDVAADHEPESGLGQAERRMISRVIDMQATDAAGAMTPRTNLTAIPVESSVAEALQTALATGHSRIPVHGRDLDDVVGIFHVKDVLRATVERGDLAAMPVRAAMRAPYFVPETMPVMALLEEMRHRRNHLAVVVDEYGGTAGVVTIEDLVEEIVGPIRDEHDRGEGEARMHRVDDDEMIADGRASLYDLNEFFGCELPEDEDYDTVAGLLFDRFGHIPRKGESLAVDGVTIEVLEADDRRIQRVRILRRAPAHAGGEAAL